MCGGSSLRSTRARSLSRHTVAGGFSIDAASADAYDGGVFKLFPLGDLDNGDGDVTLSSDSSAAALAAATLARSGEAAADDDADAAAPSLVSAVVAVPLASLSSAAEPGPRSG